MLNFRSPRSSFSRSNSLIAINNAINWEMGHHCPYRLNSNTIFSFPTLVTTTTRFEASGKRKLRTCINLVQVEVYLVSYKELTYNGSRTK